MSKMSDLDIDRQQREAEEEYMQSEQYRKEHDAQSVKEALDKAFDKKQRKILNKGALWLEFCKECGEVETIQNAETEEIFTVSELFNQAKEEHNEQDKRP